MLNITELKVDFIARLEELIEKSRHGYYKDNQENRKLGRVGVPYGNKKGLIDEELISFNNRFNKELERYKQGKMGANEAFHLGIPKGILINLIDNKDEIIMRQRVVTKGIKKKHDVKLGAIKNLPILIADPLMVFRKKMGGLGILTRTKDRDNLNVFVAIHFNQDFVESKNIVTINEVKSFHGRELKNIIEPIVDNDSLIWVNKKDSLKWISSARANSLQETSNKDYLSSAIKIVTNFENDNTNKEYLTQMGNSSEELRKSFIEGLEKFIEKSKKAQVGEIRHWSNGKDYQKQPDGKWSPVKGQGKIKPPKKDEEYFGENFPEFKNFPEAAIKFLLYKKEGQVKSAYTRSDIGKIDIVYGDENKGLKHIARRHIEEQNDFSSKKDMAKKIADILEKGTLSKTKKGRLLLEKDGYIVVLNKEVVYNKDDNFRDKIWILTSYDNSRVISDKLKKSFDYTLPGNSETDRDQSLTVFSSESSSSSEKSRFYPSSESTQKEHQLGEVVNRYSLDRSSLPKDTNNINKSQEFMQEFIEKSKKASPIGTEKTWKGKIYIKTEKGWRPKSKKKSQKEEESKESPSSNPDIENYAKKASEEQLIAATKDEKQSENIKVAAMKIFCLFYKKLCNNIANP